MIKFVPVNERGKRINEGHPRAKLSDHEVELMLELLDERKKIVGEMKARGIKWSEILVHLQTVQMSRAFIARKFEISRSYLINVEAGRKRAQFPRMWKRVVEPCGG